MNGDIVVPTDLDAIAERIRQRVWRTTADIIETGQDLRLVKERLDHGQFFAWIKSQFGMTDRTAQLYMRAAEWANDQDKPEIISVLPPSTLYALSAKSTPEPIREKVIADLEAGKRVDPREVAERVKMARAEQRHERHQQALRDDRKVRRSARYRDRLAQQERERDERHERELEAATEIIGLLKKLPAEDFERVRKLMCDRELYVAPQVFQLLREGAST